jgi:hypothetical protein
VTNADLWDWWLGTLTDADREELLETHGQHLRPEFAHHLWLNSHTLPVVVATDVSPDHDAHWNLTADVLDFVGWRIYELRNPEDMH